MNWKRIYRALTHPSDLLLFLTVKTGWANKMDDEHYLRMTYFIKFHKPLNLKNPQTFNEKLQWLKLNDRRQEYTMMVDKYKVKGYVAGIIGEKYVIPTLGVWDRPEDIDWDKLPNQFVLKTNHDGGTFGIVICKDKATFDKEKAIERLKKSIRRNTYLFGREWPYKNVERKVFAEQYLAPKPDTSDLPDFKWFCFNGEPKFCQVIQNRSTNETIDIFDTNWNLQEFIGLNPFAGHNQVIPSRPHDLELQIELARKLSKDIPFSRIDLYSLGDKTYFGEVTFFPKGGLGVFTPKQYDKILGNMIKLPDLKTE